MSREYIDRLKSDYRKTFGTASGKHVLMDLYKKCHGMDSTFPVSGNSLEMAHNEGKRWVFLGIEKHLKEGRSDLNKQWDAHMDQREREDAPK